MSDQLAEIGRRIETVRQLGAVVNAMRGIAAQRAQQGRALLPAIQRYAATAGLAIGQARRLAQTPVDNGRIETRSEPGGFVLFGAEQGFAGAFPERLLDTVAADLTGRQVLLIGARTAALAAERGLPVAWTSNLPSKASALPGLATSVLDGLSDHLGRDAPATVTMVYPAWQAGEGAVIVRRRLLPLDLEAFPLTRAGPPPLINLPPAALISDLMVECVFAQICAAAVETFVAENEARLRTMAAAHTHIDQKSLALRAEERSLRQTQITAEVAELSRARGQRAVRLGPRSQAPHNPGTT